MHTLVKRYPYHSGLVWETFQGHHSPHRGLRLRHWPGRNHNYASVTETNPLSRFVVLVAPRAALVAVAIGHSVVGLQPRLAEPQMMSLFG